MYPCLSSWKSPHPLFLHSSSSCLPNSSLPFTLPIFRSLNLPPPQYFDEEQDDHEYPYYYEETTGLPSSSAPPSPQPGAPNQQVKREQERQETQAGFVEGEENERGI